MLMKAQRPQALRHEVVGDWLAEHGDELPALRLETEQTLYALGELRPSAYLVVAGIVRFERLSAAGERRIVRVAGPGELVGQEALLAQPYRDEVIACTPVLLRRVALALLQDAQTPGDALTWSLMQRWQCLLDTAECWASEVTSGPVRRRVLQLLVRLHRHRDAHGRFWLPKRDQMGDMLQVSVETCSRMLSELRREGLLELLPPRQARLDPVRLAAALQTFDV